MTPDRIQRAVVAGNTYKKAALELERGKLEQPAAELERQITRLLAAMVAEADLHLTASAVFGDARALIHPSVHIQLAFVRFGARHCEFIFPLRLLREVDPPGFIFVAKCWALLLVLEAALESDPDLALNFVFEIGDCGYLESVAYTSKHPKACLIADYDFIASNGYAAFRSLCESNAVAWEQRLPKVFWRGSTTGRRLYPPPGMDEADSLTWLSRMALCRHVGLSDVAELCDIGISTIVQIPEPHLRTRITDSGLLKARAPREEFNRYRYCFDIDGNANAWSGLFQSLLGGCCVLKIASLDGFQEWFYKDLIPWLHYVPVASDFSNLSSRVRWAVSHPEHAQQIALRGCELATALTTEVALAQSAANFLQWRATRTTNAGPADATP